MMHNISITHDRDEAYCFQKNIVLGCNFMSDLKSDEFVGLGVMSLDAV